MIKHEIKVEISNIESLTTIINKAYFESGTNGKIDGHTHFIEVKEEEDNYSTFKGLNNTTVKIVNKEIIDGSMRFMIVDNKGDIKLYPVSIYCIKENDKYIFY